MIVIIVLTTKTQRRPSQPSQARRVLTGRVQATNISDRRLTPLVSLSGSPEIDDEKYRLRKPKLDVEIACW